MRRRFLENSVTIWVLVSLVSLPGLYAPQPTMENLTTIAAPEIAEDTTFADYFNASNAYQLLENQLDFGYRIPGTQANRDCVEWMADELNQYGTVSIINFTVEGITCQNVIAKINEGQGKILMFGAHFDSRAIGEKDPNEDLQDEPIPGANDGASGVAVLIDMARVLNIYATEWDYEIWFVLLDAEDQGSGGLAGWSWCEGSKWMADDMDETPSKYFSDGMTLEDVKFFILLDMVGGSNLEFVPVNYCNQDLLDRVYNTGIGLGYQNNFNSDERAVSIVDDHYYFYQKGIPSLDLIIKFWDTSSGWPYHHTQGDNLENIDKFSLQVTGSTLLQFLYITYSPEAGNVDFDFNPNPIFFSWDNPLMYTALLGIILLGTIIGVKYSKKIKMKRVKE